jgi:transcription elongation factor Elf1
MLKEQRFTCPYCWEEISVFLDPSVREQTYVEDCEVCCRPMHVHYRARNGQIVSFDVQAAAGQR